jgi:hypothetical protein
MEVFGFVKRNLSGAKRRKDAARRVERGNDGTSYLRISR